ncbi:glycosyltransferase family 2 protein [Sporofaciens sp. SGI.106]|uniref:glycosyltransferase family 2 protein n=1 Tax=Sporofaciens sp. SGI.106 TaxID=3420568 RepID=UPI003D00AD1F
MGEIEVSVYCLAYNHEKYIRDALEGFVKQKTTFRFEVIVHDDASTDNTASIIKEYEIKYPEIIKGIYQKENQYSQGVNILEKYIYPKIRGKYIAICEGDDCWIDEKKLQKQFDALEKHPECDMCAHRAKLFDCSKNMVAKIFPAISKERVLTVEEVIYGEGGFLPTASLFFRKDILMNPMDFQRIWSIDYTIQIRGALRGGIYFIPETMAIYRWKSDGSWTLRNSDVKSQIMLNEKKEKMLLELNKETAGRYKDIIEKRLRKNEFYKLILIGDYRAAVQKENRCFMQELSPVKQAKLYIKAYFPLIDRLYQTIKGRKR